MGKVVAIVLAATLLAAGCSGPPAPGGTTPAGPPASGPQTATPAATGGDGCAAARPMKPGRHTLTHGGLRRSFLLTVPAGPGPHPVLLDLHGLGSGAAEQSAYSRLAAEGARRGYVVAVPQAAPGRMGWTLPHTGGPDDTGFLTALLDRLEQELCTDRRRVFAAGMSYGAAMAAGLVCALDGRLAGIAAVAGLNITRPCQDAEPTTIIAFHGTADRIVPYRGGHPLRDATGAWRALADLVVLAPVEQAMDGWAQALGCTGRTTGEQGPRVRVRTWRTCPGGAALRLYTIDGGGHTWPGAIEVPRLGGTARDLDATALILGAFDRTPSR